ncbi:hypothetical protein [Vreelandella massiliensis]|uniref:hypothetical protein n=1 Tax=Vreelandella massiliensis TaxID=1816686 RepID=UPI00096A714A|nr:hypothetical protein [Halomonas massiliensis]MYL24271.1 hypothetical protein [Halomonas alkaliantarctica]
MKMKLWTAGLFASLIMAGSALAMDSETIEKHMAEINDKYLVTAEEEGKTKALEEKVAELEAMIQLILDDQDT